MSRFDRIKNLLRQSDLLYSLYQQLADLEKNHLEKSQKYQDVLFFIKKYVEKEEESMSQENLYSDFINYLSSLEITSVDYVEDSVFPSKIKEKRVFEHFFERDAIFSTKSIMDMDMDDMMIQIDDDEYHMGSGIAVLREKGQNGIADLLESAYRTHYYDEDFSVDMKKLSLYRNALELYTFMHYLSDDISLIDDCPSKNQLIDLKYRIIYLCKCLEMGFLNRSEKFFDVKAYKSLLEKLFKENEKTYSIYQQGYQHALYALQLSILNRKRKNYQNEEEQLIDYLMALRMCSMTSIIYDEQIRKSVLQNGMKASSLASTEIDHYVLKKSICIHSNYTVS